MGELSGERGWVLRGDLWRGGNSTVERDRVVLLDRDGRVVAAGPVGTVEIPAELPVLGWSGCWIGPGLVDAHVHLAFGSPDEMLSGGVLAVRDLGAPLDQALGWQHLARGEPPSGGRMTGGSPVPPSPGEPSAPSGHDELGSTGGDESGSMPAAHGLAVAIAGPVVTAPGGYPANSWGAGGFAVEVGGPDDAKAAVADLADRGVDLIKIAFEPAGGQPVPSLETARMVVDAAHSAGLQVTAHALTVRMIERALDAGVDELAHMPVEPLPDIVVHRLAAAGPVVVSTLHALRGYPSSAAEENARALVAAGARIVYGTDLGNAGTRTGAEPRELELLAQAGLGARGAVRAATEHAATVAGLAGIPGLGRIQVGRPARLVLLRRDPLVEPEAWRDPVAAVVGDSVVVMDTTGSPGTPNHGSAARVDQPASDVRSDGSPPDIWRPPSVRQEGSGGRRPRELPVHRQDFLAAAAVIVASLPIGALVGFIWERLAPTAHWMVQGGGAVLGEAQQADFIAADGWFAVLGVVAGLLAAVAGFLVFRRHLVSLPVGLAAGGLLGSLLAWWIGRQLGPPPIDSHRGAADGSTFDGPLDLSAKGVLLVWPITAVLAVLVLTLIFARTEPPVSAGQSGQWPPRSGG